MINISVALVAFPDEFSVVEKVDLKVLMQRAMRIEDRMRKGVKIEDEYRRYHTYCERLEYYALTLLEKPEIMFCDLGADYVEFLLHADEHAQESALEAKLFTDFCLTTEIKSRLNWFRDITRQLRYDNHPIIKKKIDFYETALARGWHVIELQQYVSDESKVEVDSRVTSAFTSLKVRDDIVRLTDDNAYRGLRSQFHIAMANMNKGLHASVNFSDIGHHVIAEILHEMVYGFGNRYKVPVIYADGSIARPFPIASLKPKNENDLKVFSNIAPLKVGMMSERHEELDSNIAFYWFRNQELSTGKRTADIDEAAYTHSKKLFEQIRSEGVFRIHFYQTGFQPVVVGFYRALVEELIARGRKGLSLEITPYYFLVDNYRKGKVWA